jgi:hypothetical protein
MGEAEMEAVDTYTAFEDGKLVSRGTLQDVVLKLKRRMGRAGNSPALIFSDATGNTMDFNFQGSEKEVLKRLEVFVGEEGGAEAAGPGRPRLGVVSREVSLLPRQWEWLASQSGGASAALRRLVDEAKKKSGEGLSIKQVQEKTYKFMSVMAGDLAGYEEALRALYKKDRKSFLSHTESWPPDVKAHAAKLAGPVFAGAD